MVSVQKTHPVRQFILIAGIISCALIGMRNDVILSLSKDIPAWLVRQEAVYRWMTLSAVQVASGATIPADTHVIFHLPSGFTSINREVLLGLKGKEIRYWGYCFPENDPPEVVSRRTGFPGLLFLSERERELRAAALREQERVFSPNANLPGDDAIETANNPVKPAIRHQTDVLRPDTLCYIMTEEALAIGLDPDGDRLNDKLEREVGTDPATPDSDGDGLIDGTEYLYATSPLIRDTDDDGIIDGIEDTNWNGRVGIGETDPRTKDSDRDGLCDGMCRVKLKNHFYYVGEDKNLNGVVDDGETDPRLWSTQGNGVSDEVLFMECFAEGNNEDCP